MDGRFRQQLTITDVSMSVTRLSISTYFKETLLWQRRCFQVFGICDRITWKQINWKTKNDKYRKKAFSKCWYVPRTKPPPDFIYTFHNLCRKYNFVKNCWWQVKHWKTIIAGKPQTPRPRSADEVKYRYQVDVCLQIIVTWHKTSLSTRDVIQRLWRETSFIF